MHLLHCTFTILLYGQILMLFYSLWVFHTSIITVVIFNAFELINIYLFTVSHSGSSHKNMELITVKPQDYVEPMLLTNIVENHNDEKASHEHVDLSTSPKDSLLNHSPQPV